MKNHNQEEEICSLCEAEPQDMLILSCRHNLCLDCATQVYNLNSKEDKIVCEICLSDTSLDEDTIVCLRSLSAKQIKQSQREPINYVGLKNSQNRQVFPPKCTKQGVNKRLQVPLIVEEQYTQLRCDKHHQSLTYYCMDCNNFRICSQCMLVDNHRFHKVITLKKATVQVKETIQKVIRQKERLKNMLQKDKQSLIIRKQQSQKQLEVNMNGLKSTFQEINKMIFQRYNQLCKTIQQQGSRKLEIMQGAINQIQQKITLIQQTIQFEEELIQSTLKSNNHIQNAMQMFQYYEKQITQNRLDFEPSLPNFISQITSSQLYQKQHLFAQLQTLLQDFKIISAHQIPQQNDTSQQQLNYISQIDPQQINYKQQNQKQRQRKTQKQRQSLRQIQRQSQRNFIKNKYQQQYSNKKDSLNLNINRNQFYPKPISQNINIIQLTSNKPKQVIYNKPLNNNKLTNFGQSKVSKQITQSKVSKQTVQAIKRKARQNLKDRELSHSRKMQLSRSIQNATDILNKIQQRSSRI